MEDGFSLNNSTVAIIGLGLMGGSMALALKGHCRTLIGFDPHLPTLKLALSKKIVDYADNDPTRLLRAANVIILATPVLAILTLLEQLPSLMPNPCIVLDLGSSKRQIVEAMASLSPRFDPIGGHPICGKERLGLENAQANLFQNAPFVITPLERTTSRARSAINQILSAVGSRPIELTAEAHDEILASTSHLPFLLASALTLSTPPSFASLTGPGFRSTSRLAGTPSQMMMGVLETNRENVLNSIHDFQDSLDRIELVLRNGDYAQLELLLNESCAAYELLLTDN